ncbi:MAG: LysR family transcriptional regulator [Frateuria sp.]|nr:LysR family transcriptional regulator [Frateuria sp.]
MKSSKALDLDAVKAFVLTADLQSFTRAAEALSTTQSAISLKLRRLEEQLGRRLLERTPRQVRLSAEGALFLEAARSLVGAHERAVASFQVERRRLTVGISQLIVGSELPALLRHMSEHDPRLLLELRVAGSREVMQAYEEGALDAALVVQPEGRREQGETLYSTKSSSPGSAPSAGGRGRASPCRCRPRVRPAPSVPPPCVRWTRPAWPGPRSSSARAPRSLALLPRPGSPSRCSPGARRRAVPSTWGRSWGCRRCPARTWCSIRRSTIAAHARPCTRWPARSSSWRRGSRI